MKTKNVCVLLPALCWLAGCVPSSEPVEVDTTQQALHGYDDSFTLFESGQVRPLAISPSNEYLYVTNTPDNRLEIFRIQDDPSAALQHVASVQVGLEPIAVAARNGDEVWVVNHLSDSVSVVDVSSPHKSRVVRTLLVGDEPRDIVFAGPGGARAFITTAHRGQNSPIDPQLSTAGVGRADVWVFDALQLGAALGGTPLSIITLFADTPRALAVSNDGTRVYAAGFMTGNKTTVMHDLLITNGGPAAPDGRGLPAPTTNVQGIHGPEVGLIVKYDGTAWVDELGRNWDDQVKLDLPDEDVFVIDAMAQPPTQVAGSAGVFTGVGTVLYNMAVNPVSGKVYVSNTEAFNEVRFSGPGDFADSTVQGHVHENRITVLDGSAVLPRRLNKHVDFSTCCAPLPNSESERSLALPVEMAVSADGATLYVAAMGSSKVGVFDTAELEADTFVPDASDHIELSGGGPTGLVLDSQRGRLYALTRFDNGLSIIDTASQSEIDHMSMFNPEPESVVVGRPLLYDARSTSGNGTTACGSCHVFGDVDHLAWDLGDPDATVQARPQETVTPPFADIPDDNFHPLKGPMTTQSLRGLANHGPMHWRGDRTAFDQAPSNAQPDTGLFDENAAFLEFNEAFVGLNGRHEEISPAEMQMFSDFVLQITYPPNPIRNLDNSLTPAQQRGKDHFENALITDVNGILLRCIDCHATDADANAEFGVAKPGFFGTDGLGLVEGDDFLTLPQGNDLQHLKVPHLRNLYQKVGMFGTGFLNNTVPHQDDSERGPQIRGFGYLHDGSTGSVFRFMQIIAFSDAVGPEGFPFGPEGDPLRRDVEDFTLAFDSNLKPIVGQQVTLSGVATPAVDARIDLLMERASASGVSPGAHAPECELVVTERWGALEIGYLYLEEYGVFVRSRNGALPVTPLGMRFRALFTPQTYTCVPLGSGRRVALDADLDGCYNVTERLSGHDPRDPNSVPFGC
ncbi:hypothetical protein [Haliangium ochraceum]|uniref:40-residue YVTN family beta-propeller repeat protein n=1 Tax=Haliangium ochraceum (strain DSM 14365 / JCM 11303 / SMP-2) TaxID=502025 RepID=D0LZS5_HALO1|nr:conserved hypothetical protein [Haliangium ochraceum DSM 14365]